MSQYIDEHFDEDHRDAYIESVHMDFAARESAELVASSWENFANDLEDILGHSLDGDQESDGYSLDYAHSAFNAGYTAGDYAMKVELSKALAKAK